DGASGQHDCVEVALQVLGRDITADIHVGPEGNALVLHLLDTALHDTFRQLEVRDAEAEEAADICIALKDCNEVTGPVDLLRRGEAGGPGTDYGDFLAGAAHRRTGLYPAFAPATVGNSLFDVLDRH